MIIWVTVTYAYYMYMYVYTNSMYSLKLRNNPEVLSKDNYSCLIRGMKWWTRVWMHSAHMYDFTAYISRLLGYYRWRLLSLRRWGRDVISQQWGRGGSVIERRPHDRKVVGSNLTRCHQEQDSLLLIASVYPAENWYRLVKNKLTAEINCTCVLDWMMNRPVIGTLCPLALE
jgi:hypothetical protein